MITTDLVIYTGGSCIGNKKVRASNFTAGWGAVVLEGATGHISEPDDTNASVVTRGKIWGPVITDPTAGHFAGATHGSNNTGDLTAVVESFRWILDRVEKEDKRSVLIRYDSTYAAMRHGSAGT